MAIPSPIQRQRRSCLYLTFIASGLLVLLSAGTIIFLSSANNSGNKPPATSSPTASLGVVQEVGNEYIGISDGRFAFDINRSNAEAKRQGADKFKNGDKDGARSFWLQAAAQDSSDAETLIYLEDLRATSTPNYMTLVVGTMLTGDNGAVGTGRDTLQGAYVAQKEFNDGAKLGGGKMVRLLIANSGSKSDYATTVAQQIKQLATQDHSVVGVMGWSFSSHTVKALSVLSQAHIPMVSSTASADELTGASPFFFRVAPSNKLQAIKAAKYAKQFLEARRIALFIDTNDPYSKSLGEDFSKEFVTNDYQIVATENYTVHKNADLPSKLLDALKSSPDLIYFSGYSDDLAVLLINLPTDLPNLRVLGGDALYELNGYPSSARSGFSRLHFTAFSYPDQWDILGLGSQKPAFFSEYPANFNPTHQHAAGTYGYTRADSDAILSYDATVALLRGYQNALALQKDAVTPEILRQGLAEITGDKAFQGASGQITFGADGDPVNKAVVILAVDPDGHIKMNRDEGVQGCFLVGQTGC